MCIVKVGQKTTYVTYSKNEINTFRITVGHNHELNTGIQKLLEPRNNKIQFNKLKSTIYFSKFYLHYFVSLKR